ncbi:uncharacterized protein LOC128214608 [Mya arenaria]|uniref:uncharacterized protein LOC128214608 n=1 Tax=Mya arenaria TaxID=6604 RepID=UPI0022E4E7BE|nr:uncharacterized protein LOC128214608 [Mya arenaria]
MDISIRSEKNKKDFIRILKETIVLSEREYVDINIECIVETYLNIAGQTLRTESANTIKTRILKVIKKLMKYMRVPTIIDLFASCGYVEIANQLKEAYFRFGSGYKEPFTRRPTITISKCKSILYFYCNHKQNIDNGILLNPKIFLQEQMDKLESELLSCSFNATKASYIFQKYICTGVLLVQLVDETIQRKELLEKLRSRCPENADTALLDVVVLGYSAFIEAVTGGPDLDMERCEGKLRQMFVISDQCSDGFIKAVSSMIAHYVNRRLHFHGYREGVTLERSLQYFERAEHFVSSDFADEHIAYGKRLTLLNNVESYLMITNDFQIDFAVPIPQTCRTKAEENLAILETNYFEGIEVRRKMIYYFCKAIVKAETDIQFALRCVRNALRLCSEGAYCESDRRNIQRYHHELAQRMRLL